MGQPRPAEAMCVDAGKLISRGSAAPPLAAVLVPGDAAPHSASEQVPGW
jgi:hypothetical protein